MSLTTSQRLSALEYAMKKLDPGFRAGDMSGMTTPALVPALAGKSAVHEHPYSPLGHVHQEPVPPVEPLHSDQGAL